MAEAGTENTDAYSLELKRFEAIALESIYQDLEHQLRIWDQVIPDQKELDLGKDDPLFLELMGLEKAKSGEKDQETDDVNLKSTKTELNFLLDVISSAKLELQTKSSFTNFQSQVDESIRSQSSQNALSHSLKSKKDQLQRLKKEIKEFEIISHAKEREKLAKINGLKDEIHLRKQKTGSEQRFVQVWLTARNEFQAGRDKDEIIGTRSAINAMKSQISRDCLAYENVTAWTKIRVLSLQKEILKWKDKFATDTCHMESLINEKKGHIQEQLGRIEVLENAIAEKITELIPWEEEKEREKVDKAYRMRRYYSARKIQQWWRKHMVNQSLYKGKKKPSKPTKKQSSSSKIKKSSSGKKV